VAATLVSPHTIMRPGYREFDLAAQFASPWQSIVLWTAVAAAVAYVVWSIARRGWESAAGPAVAIVAVLAGVADAALLPRTAFGYTIANYRWLWATGAFVVMLLLIGGQRWLSERDREGTGRMASAYTVGLVVLLIVPAAANMARSVQNVGADAYLAEQRSIEDALGQLDRAMPSIARDGPVLIDDSDMYFGHGYTYPLLVLMQEHDVEFRFEDPLQERRFGSGRALDGSERQRLRLLSGDQALAAQDDPSAIAFVGGPRPVVFLLQPV
jgi:hypothetical protein